jgi:probable HAF family extracellular repeat protein
VVLLPVATATAFTSGPAYADPAPAVYHAVDLGGLGGSWTLPSALNDRDDVVGSSATVGNTYHPFLWRAGTMTDLGVLPGSEENWGVARDVNDRGQVVGTAGAGAFLWDRGVLTPLRASGLALYSAEAINDRGEIVGSYLLPSGGRAHGYLWQQGRVTDLGEIDPVDINDRGEILAGRSADGSTYRACIWRKGHVTDLDFGTPVAINDRGWAVGVTVTPDYATRAVLWRSGTTTELGTLGGTSDWSTALNDQGQVLGTSRTANGELHGVLWQHGRTIDLSTHGVVLETVTGQATPGSLTGINNRGHLTGDLALPPDWSGPGVLFTTRPVRWFAMTASPGSPSRGRRVRCAAGRRTG